MSLNIKNEETHALAREVADLTGESLTAAITVALRERLETLQRDGAAVEARTQELLAIGRDVAARLDEATLDVDHSDLLYDSRGLPR